MAKSARRAVPEGRNSIGLTYTDQPFMHPKTKSCHNLVEAFVEEIGKHPTLAKVKLSSIQINHTTIIAPHADNNLRGHPSVAMGFGDFEGGRLKVEGYVPVSICGNCRFRWANSPLGIKAQWRSLVLSALHACLVGIGVGEFGWPDPRAGIGLS